MLELEARELERGVKTLERLREIVAVRQQQGDKVVLCHGVFDLLHIGHIRHLKAAREQGDCLIVTITPDQYVNKGPDRPAFHELLRAEAIAALDNVDYVAINAWPSAVNTIETLRPDVYVKGSDYEDPTQDSTGGIALERAAIEALGGKLIFTHEVQFSSSSMINKYLSPLAPEVRSYLADFARRYSMRNIHQYFAAIRNLKVLVVGETIIDDYHYCRTMGKSGKEPVLAVRYEKQETFAGGILAVANHVASVCDNVTVATFLGAEESYEGFVRAKLASGVKAHLLTSRGGQTIVKRRFVETYPFQKLFEVYLMDNDEGDAQDTQLLCEHLDTIVEDYDVVIVVDYGHGMLMEPARALLTDRSKFLAVNTQINAGNQGFNTVSKYSRADFISLSEQEMRMDVRQKKRPLEEIVLDAAARLRTPRILLTRGSFGALSWGDGEGFFEVPAFSGQTVDRVGAGDAVLAVTSLLAHQNVPMEVLGLVGNAVGYQAVQTVGNRGSLNRIALLKFLEHTLK